MRWPSLRVTRLLALAAVALNLAVAPFHGAAYFATEDGGEDLMPHQEAWGSAVRGAFPGLYDGDAYGVYLMFGKLTAAAVALFAVAFAGLHGAQDARLPPRRRTTGRVLVGAWALFALLALGEYFTPFTDALFLVMVPVLLTVLVLSGVYGVMTARAGILPRRVGWAFLAAAIAFIPLVILAGHIPFGLYAFSFAWLATLWALRAEDAEADDALPSGA